MHCSSGNDPSDISARTLPILYNVFRMHVNKKSLNIISFNLNECHQNIEGFIAKF